MFHQPPCLLFYIAQVTALTKVTSFRRPVIILSPKTAWRWCHIRLAGSRMRHVVISDGQALWRRMLSWKKLCILHRYNLSNPSEAETGDTGTRMTIEDNKSVSMWMMRRLYCVSGVTESHHQKNGPTKKRHGIMWRSTHKNHHNGAATKLAGRGRCEILLTDIHG